MMFTYMIYKSKQHACFQLSSVNIHIYTLRKQSENQEYKYWTLILEQFSV